MRVPLSFVLLAAVPTATAAADPATDPTKLRGELVDAINKRDVAAVASRVALPLHLWHLAFVAPGCKQFTGKTQVQHAELAAFVGCLADLGVKALTGVDDVFVNAIYGPGFPLVLAGTPVAVLHGWATDASDVFTIEPVTFATHIKSFTREIAPDAATKRAIDASTTDHVDAQVTVCVDGKGKVKALARVRDAARASYAHDVEAVAGAWSIAPFATGVATAEACAQLAVGYPLKRIAAPLEMQLPPPPPPPPSGGSENVAPVALEANRIAGDQLIVPDDKTKSAIAAANPGKLVASFKLCIDDTGAVIQVTLLKSSGFPDYDAKLARGIHGWAYSPYMKDGQAKPVCTAATFVYSQT